jgi:hypothetical protein
LFSGSTLEDGHWVRAVHEWQLSPADIGFGLIIGLFLSGRLIQRKVVSAAFRTSGTLQNCVSLHQHTWGCSGAQRKQPCKHSSPKGITIDLDNEAGIYTHGSDNTTSIGASIRTGCGRGLSS